MKLKELPPTLEELVSPHSYVAHAFIDPKTNEPLEVDEGKIVAQVQLHPDTLEAINRLTEAINGLK